MTFARVVRESGLTKVELAELYGVSRQSIHNWIRAEPPTAAKSLQGRMAAVITATLDTALDRRILPFGRSTPKDIRRSRVARMAAKLRGLAPAPVPAK